MTLGVRGLGRFALRTLKAFKANQGLLLAGAVAYYALLSIVPLLILIAIAVSQWIDPALLLQALERYLGVGTEVVMMGPGDLRASDLERVIAASYVPHLTLVRVESGDRTPLPLLQGRRAVDVRPTAYVCRHFSCSSPITSPDELDRFLREPAQRP